MRRIRIVQLIGGMSVGAHNGGGELFALRLAQALDQSTFDVSVCALWSYESQPERHWHAQLQEQHIPAIFCSPFRQPVRMALLASLAQAQRNIRKLQPDILNSHVEFADLIGSILRVTGATPALVRTCHNVVEWPLQPWMAQITRLLYPLVASYEVGVSRTITEQLSRSLFGRPRHTQRYIPNAIDPQHVLAQRGASPIREALGIASGAPLLGAVGRLSPQKGLADLLGAMRIVRQSIPHAHLLLVGEGELRAELEALARHYDLQNSVHFLGTRTDAVSIIASLDTLISSSHWEGLPTVIMEAMVLGVPVIATDISGSRDLVIPESTGWLVPPHRPDALAAAMVAASSERGQGERYAQQARAHVEQFTIGHVARAYAELYQSLAARQLRRRTP